MPHAEGPHDLVARARPRRQSLTCVPGFLQRISIACYAECCISYSKSVRPSVHPSIKHSMNWHRMTVFTQLFTCLLIVAFIYLERA